VNEKIRDLALNAIVENIASEKWVFTDQELQVFAESIVQECASLCYQKIVGMVGTHAGAYNSAIDACAKQIKKHFEVE
jgi:hypothetical protein